MFQSTAKRINLNPSAKIIKKDNSAFPQTMQPLIIHTEEYIEILKPQEIVLVKAEGNYASIVLKCGRNILASKTMGSIQKRLPSALFLRCHQSYLINRQNVARIKKVPSVVLCLSTGQEIPVSRSKKKEVIDCLINL